MANECRDKLAPIIVGNGNGLNDLIRAITSEQSYQTGSSIELTKAALSVAKNDLATSPHGIFEAVDRNLKGMSELMGLTVMFMGISPDALSAGMYINSYNSAFESTGKNIVGTDFNEVKPTQDWIDMNQVNNYAVKLRAGETLPSIEAINVPGRGTYILDGHHRYVAGQMTGIPVEMEITTQPGPIGLPNWLPVQPFK